MTHPWNYPPERADLQAGAGILVELSQGRSPSTLLDAIAPGDTTVFETGILNPPGLVNVTEDYVLVAVSGTQNYLQWVCHFLGSSQASFDAWPGKVNAYFGATANALLDALEPYVPLLAERRLVCIGHSFGAAVVQLVAVALQCQATRGVVTICYGGPRVGDPQFADAAVYPPFRVQTDGDVVPSFPPTTWSGTGTPWTGFAGLIPATYAHAGVVITLGSDGTIGSTDNTMGFTQAVSVAVKGKFAPHAIEEYQRLLQLINEPPSDTVWADPATVDAILDFQAINFSPLGGAGGPGMPLIQGIMYFRTSEKVWGWGESFVATTDINTMLTTKLPAIFTPRAKVLANTCQIFAVKAANIDETRTRNQSRSYELQTPVQGMGSGTAIKNPDSSETNILMDSIDYEVLSAAGSRRIYPFRGVPDSWIQGSKRTGPGLNSDGKIQAFFDAVKAQGLVMKIFDRSNDQEVIDNITQDPVTKLLKITSPGHGLASRDIVTIRAFTPNKMLNGKWRVQVNDPNTFSLVASDRFYTNANGVGTWQEFSNVPDVIDQANFSSVSTRKVGKAFGQRRGKQSAKLLHH